MTEELVKVKGMVVPKSFKDEICPKITGKPNADFVVYKGEYALLYLDDDISFDSLKEKLRKVDFSKLREKKTFIFHRGDKIFRTEKYLTYLMIFLAKAGIEFQAVGIPSCYLQDRLSSSYEIKAFMKENETEFENYFYFEDCKACRLRCACPGALQKYADQVFPVFSDKRKALSSISQEIKAKPKVILSKIEDYDAALIEKHIVESFEKLGLLRQIGSETKILIKPNLAEPFSPEKAATTHPAIVESIIMLLIKKCNPENIFLADVSAGTNYKESEKAYSNTGMQKIADHYGIKIIQSKDMQFLYKQCTNSYWLDGTDYLTIINDVDFIINVPKFKTHGISFFTGAVKNIFGTIHPEERKFIHAREDKEEFCKGLVDCFSGIAHKVAVNVIDAIIGMEGDEGPSYGNPKKIGALIISRDPVAADATACRLVGYNPEAMPTIKLGKEKLLGEFEEKEIDISKDVSSMQVKDFKKNSLFDFINKHKKEKGFGKTFLYNVKITEKCVKCGSCFHSCPVKAIDIDENGKYYINQHNCIRCYTCHECCPNHAIELIKIKNPD